LRRGGCNAPASFATGVAKSRSSIAAACSGGPVSATPFRRESSIACLAMGRGDDHDATPPPRRGQGRDPFGATAGARRLPPSRRLIPRLSWPRSAVEEPLRLIARANRSSARAMPPILFFTSREARSRSRSSPSRARKPSSQFLEKTNSSARHVWPDRRGASQRQQP